MRGRIWWIRYKVPGDPDEKFESSKSTNKQDAVRLLNRRRKEIDDRQVTGEATVGQLLQKHLADLRKQGRKDYRSSRVSFASIYNLLSAMSKPLDSLLI